MSVPRTMTIAEALNEALHEEMARDPRTLLFGEDLAETGGLFGSVGKLGLGSKTTRTAPTVGRPQFAPVAVNCTLPSFTPGIMAVKALGSKPVVSSK